MAGAVAKRESVMEAGSNRAGEIVRVARFLGLSTLAALLLPLTGCGNFFQCENKPACPASTGTGTGTGSSSTVDFAFVSYTNSAGNAVITGYNIAGGALTAINTVTLPFVPIAMAVNPKNNLLYVASVPGYSTSPGVYDFNIGTDGTLTQANGGAALVTDLVGAMTISPDGNYLYTVEATNQTTTQWTINSTTGGLTSSGSLLVSALSCAPTVAAPVLPECSVAVSPKEDYVVASLGTAGDAVFPYTSTGGVPNATPFTTIPAGTSSGDFSVALDASDNVYIAQTGTITVYGLTSTGATNRGYYTYPSGSVPRSTVVDPSSKFVYTADVGLGQITGFATGTTTALTLLTGSPFTAPASVSALGIDSTDTYLVAVGYDASAGVQLYSIAASGVLSAIKSAGTSTQTQNPVLVAMSH
ncbi:MAG TPA: beta-propeller fold lactonase family protein [Acidobacteriaceae bacterium]|nr:beta-propeller fold lactonase family protein [Acidobacteriaceae bacterium]